MNKTNHDIIFGSEARKRLIKGVEILTKAVGITMGPSGQTVVIERENAAPQLTKDGVTVAQQIRLKEKYANLGAQIIKEAAQRTAEVAGDGTTTATILAHAILSEGNKLLDSGYRSLDLLQGIRIAVVAVIEQLKKDAFPIKNSNEIIQIGAISSNGDQQIGKLIERAITAVGKSGIITVEEAKGFKTSLEIVEGVEIKRGYLSPYFITHQEKMASILENPVILLATQEIKSLNDLLPILEKIRNENRPLLIIAPDVEGEALQGLVLNQMKGRLQVCAIRSPEFGDARTHVMDDLGLILNTKPLSDLSKNVVSNIKLTDLGTCRKIIVTRTNTVFIDCPGDQEKIQQRIVELTNYLSAESLEQIDVESTQRRLNRLSNKAAILKIGGATEAELKEKRDRVDDALSATSAAIEEGILPGGGIALIKAAQTLRRIKKKQSIEGVRIGIEIIERACEAPFKKILQNLGISPDIYLSKIKRSKVKKSFGYDVNKMKYVDMLESGIIDPLKVTRSALENASSAACNLLSAGCAITFEQDESLSNFSKIV